MNQDLQMSIDTKVVISKSELLTLRANVAEQGRQIEFLIAEIKEYKSKNPLATPNSTEPLPVTALTSVTLKPEPETPEVAPTSVTPATAPKTDPTPSPATAPETATPHVTPTPAPTKREAPKTPVSNIVIVPVVKPTEPETAPEAAPDVKKSFTSIVRRVRKPNITTLKAVDLKEKPWHSIDPKTATMPEIINSYILVLKKFKSALKSEGPVNDHIKALEELVKTFEERKKNVSEKVLEEIKKVLTGF